MDAFFRSTHGTWKCHHYANGSSGSKKVSVENWLVGEIIFMPYHGKNIEYQDKNYIMTDTLENKLVIAISSRALFNLEESHNVFIEQGLDAYSQYQIDNEDTVLEPGEAFTLVQRLLKLNDRLRDHKVEVILLSRNSADTGLRIFNSIREYGLDIVRAAFCSGSKPESYVTAFNCHLFLSADAEDVKNILAAGTGAARLLPITQANEQASDELRIAFDGDAVLFSDDAEKIYQEHGLEAFATSESNSAYVPLPGGPFKPFLNMVQRIQKECGRDCPIRTALVTARSAPAHERVIRTLRSWNIRLDEALFLGGLDKGIFIKAFAADIFFDDQVNHCHSAHSHHISTGHVPHGVTNKQ